MITDNLNSRYKNNSPNFYLKKNNLFLVLGFPAVCTVFKIQLFGGKRSRLRGRAKLFSATDG